MMDILTGETIKFQNKPRMSFANLILLASLFLAFTSTAAETAAVGNKITRVKIITWKWGRIQSSALRVQEFLLRTQRTGRLGNRFESYSVDIRNHKHLAEFSSIFEKYNLYNLPYDTESLLKTKKPYMVRSVVKFSINEKNEIILVLYTENGKSKANWLVSKKTPPMELLAKTLLCFPLFEYTNKTGFHIIDSKMDLSSHVKLEKVGIYFSNSSTESLQLTQLNEMSMATFSELNIQISPSAFTDFLTQRAIGKKIRAEKSHLFVKCVFNGRRYFFPLIPPIENAFRIYEPVFLNSRYTPLDILNTR